MTKVKKSKITLLVAVIVTATTVLSIQQANAFERGDKRIEKSFERLDTNLDGQLSVDELLTSVATKVEAKFTSKDVDADGLLSLAEFQQGRDGEVADLSAIADEIVTCVADIKDSTGNDLIVVPSATQFSSSEEKFANIDTSADGFISLDEMQASAADKVNANFKNIDSDDDGLVNLAEYKFYKQSKHATRGAIKQCIDEITADELI